MFRARTLVFILNLFKGYNTFSRPYIISVVGVVKVNMVRDSTNNMTFMVIIKLVNIPNIKQMININNSIVFMLFNVSRYIL